MVNINKLKGKIVECSTSVNELSVRMGIDKATFYRKLNTNGDTFFIKEADIIAKELSLSGDEVQAIFFSQYIA